MASDGQEIKSFAEEIDADTNAEASVSQEMVSDGQEITSDAKEITFS